MKKLIRLLALALFAISFQACSNDKESELDGNHRYDREDKPVLYKFRLALGGDYIEQTEEPLSRANDDVTYVGINVTRKERSSSNAKPEPYAYGVFTNKDDISINLQSGYIYDFEATILIDDVDKLSINKKIGAPFRYKQDDKQTDLIQPLTANKDRFIYFYEESDNALKGYLSELSSGTAFVKLTDQPDYPITSPASCKYPRVKRFYGTKQNIDPEELAVSKSPITIKMQYKCFGLRIETVEIPYGTSLTVKDVNFNERNLSGDVYSHIMFPKDLKFAANGTTEWENIFSMNNLTDDNPISFELIFTWDRGVGKSETFKTTIQVEPKFKKILLIKINGTANNQHTGNIILEDESTDLEPDEETIEHNGN